MSSVNFENIFVCYIPRQFTGLLFKPKRYVKNLQVVIQTTKVLEWIELNVYKKDYLLKIDRNVFLTQSISFFDSILNFDN